MGAVDIVCNNAGVASLGDPWFDPLSMWQWVMGVNFWGVLHGCRAFLPLLTQRGGGHIVNTASIAGLLPGTWPAYDASKHAVVAISEDLHHMVQMVGLPVGVSVVCPGWVHTSILDAVRNWPPELGERPQPNAGTATIAGHYRKAVDNGLAPATVADTVIDAVEHGRFWVFPQQEFLDLAVRRFNMIAERREPTPADQIPGMPPRSQLVAEVRVALGLSASSRHGLARRSSWPAKASQVRPSPSDRQRPVGAVADRRCTDAGEESTVPQQFKARLTVVCKSVARHVSRDRRTAWT